MSFTANPLSLSVPDPAFESWLRDTGYLEILDNHHHHHKPQPPPSTTTAATAATVTATATHLKTILSLLTTNPFAKLTSDDFSNETPSWTVGFIGYSVDSSSYSFPSSPSQATLRVHENVRRYCRNYAVLFLLVFACTLYQMPVSLFGLIACLLVWELFKWCGEKAGWTKYPHVQQSLIRLVQCVTAVILYWSGVQMALFCAIAVTYGVVIMHASLRKLSPLKQTSQMDGKKWFRPNKRRN